MENNEIEIKFGEEFDSIILKSNDPDLEKIVKVCVERRDEIDPNKIEVNCNDANFDVDGFTKIIRVSIKEFLDKLVIDYEKIKEVVKIINDNSNIK